MMSDTVIVSYAKKGREDYPTVLPRLVESALQNGYTGDFILCAPGAPDVFRVGFDHYAKNEFDLPVPDHHETPYGFKPYLVKLARDRGFKKVFWFDSTIVMTRDFKNMMEELDKKQILLFDNPGCYENIWTSDDCLAKMGCSLEEANKFYQVMACAMGFDFSSPFSTMVFDLWYAFGLDGISFKGPSGSTRPEFRGHRHDQSVISYLSHLFKIKVIPYGFLSYWDDREKFNSVICNRGIGQS